MKLRKAVSLCGVIAFALVLGVNQAVAQRGAGANPQPGQYDLTAERTVTGTVDAVRSISGTGPATGTHVTLKTATETIELALGPTSYMTDKKFALAAGDRIEVTGAKATVEGGDVLIVREIKKGSETMVFRNAQGVPLWSPRGGR